MSCASSYPSLKADATKRVMITKTATEAAITTRESLRVGLRVIADLLHERKQGAKVEVVSFSYEGYLDL